MTPEHALQNDILLTCAGGDDTRLFRNNTGTGWAGSVLRRADGSVLVRDARPLHAGLCVGSSDLIGWRALTITPDMVGQRLAVFCAVEVKTPRGVVSAEQARFVDAVRDAGGLSGIARSTEQALHILRKG